MSPEEQRRAICGQVAEQGAKALGERLAQFGIAPRVLVFVIDVDAGPGTAHHFGLCIADPVGEPDRPFPWDEFHEAAKDLNAQTCPDPRAKAVPSGG